MKTSPHLPLLARTHTHTHQEGFCESVTNGPRGLCDYPANLSSDLKISIRVGELQKKGCDGSAEKCSVFPVVKLFSPEGMDGG